MKDADEVMKLLAEALQWMIDNDETNTGDIPMKDYGGATWNEMNAYWIEGLKRAETAMLAYREYAASPLTHKPKRLSKEALKQLEDFALDWCECDDENQEIATALTLLLEWYKEEHV